MLNFLVCAAFYRSATTDLLGWFGTIASFGFIIVYLLCSIASPVLLRKTGDATPLVYVMGVVCTVMMSIFLVGSVYPVPAAPYNYLPYGFALYMLLGAAWFVTLKGRKPELLLGMDHDLEGVVTGAK